jgi:hypothetical protein
MPPKGNPKKNTHTHTNKWKCHQKSSTKTQETKHKTKKETPSTKNRKSGEVTFLIKPEERNPTILKANKNKKKFAARKMFPSPTQVQHKCLR